MLCKKSFAVCLAFFPLRWILLSHSFLIKRTSPKSASQDGYLKATRFPVLEHSKAAGWADLLSLVFIPKKNTYGESPCQL